MRRYSRDCGPMRNLGETADASTTSERTTFCRLRVAAVIGAFVAAGTISGCSLFAPDTDEAASGRSLGLPAGKNSAKWPGASTLGPGAPQVTPLGNKSVRVKDRVSDAKKQGKAPGYADITLAAIEDLGKDVRLVITMHEAVPQKMPDETTHMIVSWNISGDKKHQTRGFSLQGTSKGWSVDAGGNEGSVRYPGTYAVTGNQLELKFPWSFLDGRRTSFQWSASSFWSASAGTKPSSSVDDVKGRYRMK